MALIATTKGLGPFYPTIIFGDHVFVSDKPFKDEDEAAAHAQQILQQAELAAKAVIRAAGFEP